ncbi:hypothetical protein, partial [Phosphitispora fastidiosa]|uniref:hypothetical protein n=1 Tax=Phosphitispora fastidiosa TaxID=2837202 RepID=UPI001E4EC7AB
RLATRSARGPADVRLILPEHICHLKIFGLRLAQTFLFSSILLKYEKLFVKIKWLNLLTKSGFC